MPKRGSVQFLLLPSRPRAMRWLGLGAIAIVLLLVGVVQLREQLPLLGESGLTQALRQSAWEHALAGQSQAEHWPWEDASANMSLAPAGKVRRLGLSAQVLKHDADAPQSASIESRIEPRRTAQKADKDPAALGDVAISDVAIGDSITFTAADGATCVYRLTGRHVVDPHLAENSAERSDSGASPFICSPLDRLILKAAEGALNEAKPPVAPQAADDQQKL
jgi:hypothetical protein